MALLSKRNSFFSYEDAEVAAPTEPAEIESEVREQTELENEVQNEVATIEEENEVVDSLAEQATDNATLIEQAPEEVTEEVAQEAARHALLKYGRLGLGTDSLHYIKIGNEASNTPLQNLQATQEGIIDTIKQFFIRIWEWIKKMAGKIKDFFVNLGRRIKSLVTRGKGLIGGKVGVIKSEDIDPKGGAALASICKCANFSSSTIQYSHLVMAFTPVVTFNANYKNLNDSKMKFNNSTGPLAEALANALKKQYQGIKNLEIYSASSSQGKVTFYGFAEQTDNKLKHYDLPGPEASDDDGKEYIAGIIQTQKKYDELVDWVVNKLEGLQKKSADSFQKAQDEIEKVIGKMKDYVKSVNGTKDDKVADEDKKIIEQKEIASDFTKAFGNFTKGHVLLASITDTLIKNAEKLVKSSKLPADGESK